jgi:arabinogalactan oligomer/maltooligosaccharide transport system permease protein
VYELPDLKIDPHLTAFKTQVERSVADAQQSVDARDVGTAAQALRAALRAARRSRARRWPRRSISLKVQTRQTGRRRRIRRLRDRAGVDPVGAGGVEGVADETAARAGASCARRSTPNLYFTAAAVSMLLLVFIPFIVGNGGGVFRAPQGEFTFVGLANFINILMSADYPASDHAVVLLHAGR